jgi:2-methylcitrate dehydratase
VQVFFHDGTATERIEIEYPLGHRRRRDEAAPLLFEKFRTNAATRLSPEHVDELEQRFRDTERFDGLALTEMMSLVTANHT